MARWRRSGTFATTRIDRDFISQLTASIAADPDFDDAKALARRVGTYLTDGEDPDIVTAVRAAHSGWYRSSPSAVIAPRRTAYARFDHVNPVIGYRWAVVLSGCPTPGGPTLAPIAGADWAEALAADIAACFAYAATTDREAVPLTCAAIDAAVVAGGGRSGEFLEAVFSHDPHREYARVFHRARGVVAALPDFSAAVAAHAGVLAPIAAAQTGLARQTVLELLASVANADLVPFADALAAYLVATNAQLAGTAELVAVRCPADAMVAALKRIATTGNSSTQIRALRAIWKLGPTPADRAWAVEFAASATSAAAKALAREWAQRVTRLPDATTPTWTGRTRTRDEWQVQITPELHTALQRLCSDLDALVHAAAADLRRSPVPAERARAETLEPIDDAVLDGLETALSSGYRPTVVRELTAARFLSGRSPEHALVRFASSPGVGVISVLIVLQHFGILVHPAGRRPLHWEAARALNANHAATDDFDLADLQRLLDTMGLPGRELIIDAYCNSWTALASTWPAAAVAPFIDATIDTFARMLATDDTYAYNTDVTAPYRALATLPHLPDAVADTLYRIALGSKARTRVPAQDALTSDTDRIPRIHTALLDPSADTRAVAAEWLGRIGATMADSESPDTTAVEALEAAYRAERTDRVKQTQLNALAALGRPPQHYLNRQTLDAEVAKAAGKAPPTDLAWLDADAIVEVRWAQEGTPVPVETLTWLLATAVRLKSPEPTVAMRYYCALLDPIDRQRFGDQILDLWLTSASIKSKGVLAVCAVCCRDNAAPLAEHFIRTHYGNAAAHCKALLAMLAHVDAPNAIQTLLAISTRFRTRGIQDEAGVQVRELAARKGWTTAELADRTVPDGGFGTGGRMVLDYGPRQFTAQISPSLTLALFAPDGKPVKSLPAPRNTDDPEKVAAAKRQLTAARKAVKTTVVAQRDRLYEAMCAERSWPTPDWKTHIQAHPIVGVLAERLIWLARVGDWPPIVFRPLDDGTLTDADDEEVTLDPTALISLVHRGALDPSDVALWRTHLADYEVDALFEQLGEPVPLDDVAPDARSHSAYEGYLLDAFTLRSATGKRGYARGPTGDGGIFTSYVKRFPAAGLVAVLGFSGNALPEENTTVALTELTFETIDGGHRRPLAEVPGVLLRETIADLAAVAATGTYDPDWRRKVLYA